MSDVLKDGKKFRLVGDNINWNTEVCDQRLGRNGKMTNAFTSACVVQELYFDELDDKQGNLSVSVDTYMFGEEDYECVKKLYVSLVLEVVQRNLKSIAFINSDQKIFHGKDINKCSHETEVIPLPVLYFDEQKNGDVIKILHWYQQLIEDVHQKAGVSLGSVHIRGD